MTITSLSPAAQALDATLSFFVLFSSVKCTFVFFVIHLLIFISDLYNSDE